MEDRRPPAFTLSCSRGFDPKLETEGGGTGTYEDRPESLFCSYLGGGTGGGTATYTGGAT